MPLRLLKLLQLIEKFVIFQFAYRIIMKHKEAVIQKCPVNFAKFLKTPFLQNTSGGCF